MILISSTNILLGQNSRIPIKFWGLQSISGVVGAEGEYKTQIRGGLGVFTSRIPLVWPGGSYNNNGVTGGYAFIFGPDFGFNPDVNSQPVTAEPGTGENGGNIDIFARNLKLPQIMSTKGP